MADACGDNRRTQAQCPQKKGWQGVTGPLLTLALAGTLLWLGKVDVHVPNPVLFFANLIVLSAFLGGICSGLASVAVTFAFVLIYWSAPGHVLQYAPRDLERLAVLALTMPPLGLLVGRLRLAYERKQRELVAQNVQLATELTRRAALEEMQRDVDHILRHDLRTPLTGIISIPELLLEDGNLTEKQRELLDMVSVAGSKMLNQINSSLELRKIEDGSYTCQPEPCDPARILQDNFRILSVRSPAGRPRFRLLAPEPVLLQTDCRILDAIVANLLGNALEASDRDAPVVVELVQEQGECVIAIANNRPVPEEIRSRFFEKYVTAGKVGGTGLGTYSAWLMTTALGGTIAMDTSSEAGTKVTVRIPLGTN
ncbi:diguanylate cyclase/phosphodiesterase (GGDEF & EAL domains) with PAS/PAC sensor(s) [Desulfovibrio sp. DV]|uniref:sensor histidine kinase n=1 Tax=Desulfovibrio sp. DV TaxID=1844708 RepID=UPI00094B9DEF|nr:HAMP domain-containing sensor histidine kinase [Desulfovibrio sp. DV]OLN24530.1 diguanylate cyclase/phosphodiesterase (GGDEF & EAL domains) with PAS/PAC sensor(s) [Desulfovibrio sp. DV]